MNQVELKYGKTVIVEPNRYFFPLESESAVGNVSSPILKQRSCPSNVLVAHRHGAWEFREMHDMAALVEGIDDEIHR